jgi:hypothetical protein
VSTNSGELHGLPLSNMGEIYHFLYLLVWIRILGRMTRTFYKVWDDAEVQRVIEEAMKEMDKEQ